jgi:hypothetical protein
LSLTYISPVGYFINKSSNLPPAIIISHNVWLIFSEAQSNMFFLNPPRRVYAGNTQAKPTPSGANGEKRSTIIENYSITEEEVILYLAYLREAGVRMRQLSPKGLPYSISRRLIISK